MRTICESCKHQDACGHAEVEACANYAASHWADAMPTLERTKSSDGTVTYRSEVADLSGTPGCSCDGLRQALSDAACKGREIARLDAVVEELQKTSDERTCTLASTQLTRHAPEGNTYHTYRIVCSECRHDMPEHGDSIQYCPWCGAKVIA